LRGLGISPTTTAAEFTELYLRNTELCPQGHGGHSLVARGLFALQLEPWLEHFPLAPLSPAAAEGKPGLLTLAPAVPLPGALHAPAAENAGGAEGKRADKGRLMVVKLEDMMGKGSQGADPRTATQRVMNAVFAHVGLEQEPLVDVSAKNSREYVPLKESGAENVAAAERLRSFYAPFNRNLDALLGCPSFTSGWD
jgi:hypothetical protein